MDLRADDEKVKETRFKSYRSNIMRRAVRYNPGKGEPEEIAIQTPWGEKLNCRRGDYIVSEMDDSEDSWPVSADIFEETYMQVEPEVYIKKALMHLVPLTEFTRGKPDVLVAVHTLEGVVKVPAGEFFLARGTRGEIWPVPSEKIQQMRPVDDEENVS